MIKGFNINKNQEECGVPIILQAYRVNREFPPKKQWFVCPFWLLDYAFTDLGTYRIGNDQDKEKNRLAGTSHLYPPNVPYWENMGKGPIPNGSAWIGFTNGVTIGLDSFLMDKFKYASFTDSNGKIGELFEKIFTGTEDNNQNNIHLAYANFHLMLDLILNQAQHQQDEFFTIFPWQTDDVGTDFVRAVNIYLRNHKSKKITLPEIARNLNVSLSTLTHRYKAETGKSPMETLTELRIDAAKGLLYKGERLKVIAEMVGFCDEYYLSRIFKKYTGMSPGQYARSQTA